MGYDTTEDYKSDMPPLAQKIIKLAREKKKDEGWNWAAGQAEEQKANYPDNAEFYSRSNNYGYSDQTVSEYMDSIDSMFGEIETAFMRFAEPDPADFDDLIAEIQEVEDRLATGEAETSAASALSALSSDWDGAFSTNLSTAFFGPMEVIPQNLRVVAQTVRETLEANQAVFKTAQNNLYVLGQKTVEALETVTDKDPDDTKFGLAILAAVTAIGAAALAIPTGGTSVALYVGAVSLTTVSASATVASGLIPPEEPKPLGGETVDEVIANMYDGIQQAYSDINTAEDDIIKVLSDNYDEITEYTQQATKEKQASLLSPMRPSIADASDPTSGLKPDD